MMTRSCLGKHRNQNMRRTTIIVGAILLVILLSGAAAFGYLKFKESTYNITSRKYVDEAVPAIVQSWSKDIFLQYADSDLKKAATDDEFGKTFIKLDSMCGPLIRYDGAKGGANISISLRYRTAAVTAVYRADVQCARTNAIVDLHLTLTRAGWKVSYFNVTILPSILGKG